MSLPYKIKVFIAGSKDLYHERNAVRSQLQQISNRTNIVFASYTYEDFSRDFALDGRQTDYNGFIAHKADFAVFIIDGKIGGITFEEFKVAVESFKREMKPRIFTYCKDVNVDDPEINQIIHGCTGALPPNLKEGKPPIHSGAKPPKTAKSIFFNHK